MNDRMVVNSNISEEATTTVEGNRRIKQGKGIYSDQGGSQKGGGKWKQLVRGA